MEKYSISSLIVKMEPVEKSLIEQFKSYKIETECEADIEIDVSQPFLLQKKAQNPHLSMNICEYIYTGADFYEKLLDFNGFMLHASAVALDGQAYLFSAKSGVGKSTHAALWLEYFGECAYIINDDKPALRIIDSKFMVCGTPWSGKTDKNINKIVQLKAITFLERGNINSIRRIDAKEALPLILEHTLRPINKINELMLLLDRLLTEIPIYKLTCDMSIHAVEVAYRGLL
ncbi:MAG TPA: hypothetical protein DCP51_08265 [Clostridiales bacterium]|nr:hypothetical protein [Clostridiales bacterium]